MSRGVDPHPPTKTVLKVAAQDAITDYDHLPRKTRRPGHRVRNHQSNRQHDQLKRKRKRGGSRY